MFRRTLLGWMGCCGLVLSFTAAPIGAQELFLTDAGEFPGKLLVSRDGAPERQVHRRADRADPAFPRAIMKLAQTAIDVEGKHYYVSGLDGSVMHLLDGRHEIQVFEFPGQIRDLACTHEPHVIYFSVVPTPQNGEQLADGKIYRRDLWAGAPTEVAVVRQADVGGNWWGMFAVKGDDIYLATHDQRSRLFKLTGGALAPVFADNTFKLSGFCGDLSGGFYVATGTDKISRTTDFRTFEPVLRAGRNLTDVSLRPAAALRP